LGVFSAQVAEGGAVSFLIYNQIDLLISYFGLPDPVHLCFNLAQRYSQKCFDIHNGDGVPFIRTIIYHDINKTNNNILLLAATHKNNNKKLCLCWWKKQPDPDVTVGGSDADYRK